MAAQAKKRGCYLLVKQALATMDSNGLVKETKLAPAYGKESEQLRCKGCKTTFITSLSDSIAGNWITVRVTRHLGTQDMSHVSASRFISQGGQPAYKLKKCSNIILEENGTWFDLKWNGATYKKGLFQKHIKCITCGKALGKQNNKYSDEAPGEAKASGLGTFLINKEHLLAME